MDASSTPRRRINQKKVIYMTTQAVQLRWDEIYSSGVDFTHTSTASLSRLLDASGLSGAHPSCLDIGCGTGQLVRELYHRGFQVLGIDISESAISIARASSIRNDDVISYRTMDVESNDLLNLYFAPYDLITCKLVFAFIKDKPRLLERVYSALKDNRVFTVMTPLPEDVFPDKKHIAVVYDDTMSLLNEYFEEVESYREQSLTYFIARKAPKK